MTTIPSKPHRFRAASLAAAATLAAPGLTAATVFVNFGDSVPAGSNWNAVTDTASGTVANAVDSAGAATGIGVTVTEGFTGVNRVGTTSPSAPYPTFATDDSFFLNADAAFGGDPINPSGTVTFSGLDPTLTYDFIFFASRTGVSDNRSARYTVTGTGPATFAELDASNNVTNTVSIDGVAPTAGGVITLVTSEGSANNNGSGFAYLGAVELNYVPEPGVPILVAFCGGLMALRRRR